MRAKKEQSRDEKCKLCQKELLGIHSGKYVVDLSAKFVAA
jgi:hypothetical protein